MNNTKFDEFLIQARKPDNEVGYEPPLQIPCPRCGGTLGFAGLNVSQPPNNKATLAFVECMGDCKHCYTIGIANTK